MTMLAGAHDAGTFARSRDEGLQCKAFGQLNFPSACSMKLSK
jgi:hypothetical protein